MHLQSKLNNNTSSSPNVRINGNNTKNQDEWTLTYKIQIITIVRLMKEDARDEFNEPYGCSVM